MSFSFPTVEVMDLSGKIVQLEKSQEKRPTFLLYFNTECDFCESVITGLLDTFDSGTYELDGLPMHHLEDQQAAIIRNQKIGFVFQSFNLISYKTTLENVALPLLYKGIPRKKRFDMAYEYLDMVGLSEWSSHLPTELSGGQRQ